MDIKKILTQFVPPIITDLITIRKKEYLSFDEALNDSTRDAYQDVELCDMIADKTKNHINDINNTPFVLNTPNAFLLSAINQYISKYNPQNIKLADLGGACGAHYFETKRFLPPNLGLEWYVIETQQMVVSAKIRSLATKELYFFNSIQQIKVPIDIIHSSGTLQYVPSPYNTLSDLLNKNAKWLFFNRMMFNENDREFITVQKSKMSSNGPGPLPKQYVDRTLFYPHTTLSFNKFNELVSKEYTLEWIFEETSGSYKINNENIIGRGLLYTKKNY